jgi:hypothetical protein
MAVDMPCWTSSPLGIKRKSTIEREGIIGSENEKRDDSTLHASAQYETLCETLGRHQ